MPFSMRTLSVGVGAPVLVLAGAMIASSIATGAAGAADEPTSPTADGPTYAIEDFSHPNGEEIFAEHGVVVKQGDGRIMFDTVVATPSDCADSTNIAIESRNGGDGGLLCFITTGPEGFLTLEVDDVYGIWTQDHPVEATLTAEEIETVVDVPANDFKPVGEGGGGARSVLVELRVTG